MIRLLKIASLPKVAPMGALTIKTFSTIVGKVNLLFDSDTKVWKVNSERNGEIMGTTYFKEEMDAEIAFNKRIKMMLGI